MKKLIIIAVIALMGATQLKAQDCEELVLPFFHNDMEALRAYPQPKLDYRCAYCRNSFYVTDTVPEGSSVFQISQLTNVMDGSHMSANVAIDLNHLSYYAYDFDKFQFRDYHRTIYFQTPGSTHRYLAVRSMDETYLRTEFPERYMNENK